MGVRENPLHKLQHLGQSVWLDGVTPALIASGGFRRLIEEDGVSGFTASTAALRGSSCAPRSGHEGTAWQHLTVRDVADAADLLWPVYTRTGGANGFASIEVSPHLAYDTGGMLEEARELWHSAYRPNLMIAVPATRAGLPVIRQLIAEGISVNVTMLFGSVRYREAFDAYCDGLEDRLAAGMSVADVASVASFPLGLIDAHFDALLEVVARNKPHEAARLAGRAAVACATYAYADFHLLATNKRCKKLGAIGAQLQRPLWVCSLPGNPAEPATRYIEPLIGPDTISAMSPGTLAIYRENGRPATTLYKGFVDADAVMTDLGKLNIDWDTVAQELELKAIAASLANSDSAFPAATGMHAALP